MNLTIEQSMLILATVVTAIQAGMGIIKWWNGRGKETADEVKVWTEAAQAQVDNALKIAAAERDKRIASEHENNRLREEIKELRNQMRAAIERMTKYEARLAKVELDNVMLRAENEEMENTIREQAETISTLRERIKHLEDR